MADEGTVERRGEYRWVSKVMKSVFVSMQLRLGQIWWYLHFVAFTSTANYVRNVQLLKVSY